MKVLQNFVDTENDPDSCGGKTCDHRATCASVAGQPACICHAGFEGLGEVKDGKPGCIEIDPCKDNKCDEDAICYSALGKPVCKCKIGFAGDGFKCVEGKYSLFGIAKSYIKI